MNFRKLIWPSLTCVLIGAALAIGFYLGSIYSYRAFLPKLCSLIILRDSLVVRDLKQHDTELAIKHLGLSINSDLHAVNNHFKPTGFRAMYTPSEETKFKAMTAARDLSRLNLGIVFDKESEGYLRAFDEAYPLRTESPSAEIRTRVSASSEKASADR